jgi:hypothetical protein
MNQLVSSRWITDFIKHHYHRLHTILSGNIHDQFLWRGNYQNLEDFLNCYFHDLGFEVIINYDPIDGFNFHHQKGEKKFKELTKKQAILPSQNSLGNDNLPSSPNPLSSTKRRNPGEIMPQNLNRRISPEDAFGDLRVALSQSKSSIVSIINLGDMLTTDGSRYSADERNPLVLLKKCLLEASIIAEGELQGYRNTIIIIANDLKRIPEWLHLNPEKVREATQQLSI